MLEGQCPRGGEGPIYTEKRSFQGHLEVKVKGLDLENVLIKSAMLISFKKVIEPWLYLS